MIRFKKPSKQTIKEVALKYWWIILIIINIVVSVFLYEQKRNTNEELNTLRTRINITEDIEKLESKYNKLKEARDAISAELEEKKKELTEQLRTLEEQRKLTELNKKKVVEDVKKLSLKDLNHTFNILGYTNRISPSSED